VAEVLCKPGAGRGAGGLTSAGVRFGVSTEEVLLNWNHYVRQVHRWLSIAFTVAVIANFVSMGLGDPH
jgi:hypothetical protein